jgi:DNA-binding response OmpR family regulator
MASDNERALRAENDELRERVRQLEEALSPALPPTWDLPLPAAEARALGVLFRNPGIVTRDSLYVAMCGIGSESDSRVVLVRLVSLRRHLRPHGVEIRNAYGKGYFLPPESRARVAALIEEQRRVAAAAVKQINATHNGGKHVVLA